MTALSVRKPSRLITTSGRRTTALILLLLAFGLQQTEGAQSTRGPDASASIANEIQPETRTAQSSRRRSQPDNLANENVPLLALPFSPRSAPTWPNDRFDKTLLPPKVDEYQATGTNLSDASRRVVALTNDERTERTRKPLEQVTQLALIACRHNKDMLAHDYAGHEDADGRRVNDRLFREHRTLLVSQYGENVQEAWGNQIQEADLAALPVNGWMDSPPHRKNILRPPFTHLGACVTRKDDKMRATQVFATVAGELNEPLPWSLSPGDSLATPVRSSQPGIKFERYGFQRAGSDGNLDFEDTIPFDGTIHVPSEPGRYELRMLYVKASEGDSRTYHFSLGPRIRVTAP